MFGNLRYVESASIQERKKQYCTLCKIIGKEYGQIYRTVLNFDSAFLLEILNNCFVKNFGKKTFELQAGNCFQKIDKKQIPEHVKFVAAVNILLAGLMLDDKIMDSKNTTAKLQKRIFSKKFLKAKTYLNSIGFPISQIFELVNEQQKRENQNSKDISFYAECTALITALSFAYGAKLIDKSFYSSFYNLGYQFGALIYMIDAFDDYDTDIRKKQFNAFAKVFNCQNKRMTKECHAKVVSMIEDVQNQCKKTIAQLPIDYKSAVRYSARIELNLHIKLNKTNCCKLNYKCKSKFYQRWANARAFAKSKVETLQHHEGNRRLKGFMLLQIFSIVSFFNPHCETTNNYQKGDFSTVCGIIIWGCLALFVWGIISSFAQAIKRYYGCANIEYQCKNEACCLMSIFRFFCVFPICCFLDACCDDLGQSIIETSDTFKRDVERRKRDELYHLYLFFSPIFA